MDNKRKLKLKKFYLHPVSAFMVFTVGLIVLSAILSLFQAQATYNVVNVNTKDLEPTLVTVENMLSFDGLKFIISEASKNFLSFGPLGTLLISLIGLTIGEGTGFIETLTKRHLSKIPKFVFTFLVILLATISSLINEVGYAILIPLVALIYFINNRNPILGIITAFCGVSFGYGVSVFVGSMELSLIDYTKTAAMLVDETSHIALTSNLIFIIAATIILSVVGTIVIEKIIAPRIGKYKKDDEFAKTEQYSTILSEEQEQLIIEKDKYENRGLRAALIVSIILLLILIYSLIPNLPLSGMLLDTKEKAYVYQLFGENAYFQDGFTFLVSLVFILSGIAYGFASKSMKSYKQIIENAGKKFSQAGPIFILIFVASQYIAIFRKSNIGLVVTSWLAALLKSMNLTGIPLILIALLFIAISNFFLTSPASKWMIFSPVIVPMFMQSNISPQFAQIVMRAGDSMTKGLTPLLAYFVIYLGYLNVYNTEKEPISIRKAMSFISPYCLLISLVWILISIFIYVIGIPIGPGISPVL